MTAAMTFLPWLRQGLANEITAPSGVQLRATIKVDLELQGLAAGGPTITTISRDVQLVGPGDIVGIDSRAIVRTEPRSGITNFEPNYLAFIEFSDDLPWRYTPEPVVQNRLRPWIMLMVLKEGEFADEPYQAGRPLSCVRLSDDAPQFPAAADLSAWAHVHFNGSLLADPTLVKSTDATAVAQALQSALDVNPDLASSRILCLRQLDPNASYHAFLIPVFETGRLAGLGLDPANAPAATTAAWEPYPTGKVKDEPNLHPYFHRWYFRTGGVGDFEYLVRLLKPKPADHRVGRRDLDATAPGATLPSAGVQKLGGALRVPVAALKPDALAQYNREENWRATNPLFQPALARFINLADDYSTKPAKVANKASGLGPVEGDPDPLVTSPLYGRWHAQTQRLLYERNGNSVPNAQNWVHRLNLDPRHRVAAGLGTGVIQKNQEDFMRAAWAQVGDVLEANRLVHLSQLGVGVSSAWYDRHVSSLAANEPERAFVLTAPVQSRIVVSGSTVRHQIRQSKVPTAVLSPAMRKISRRRGALARNLPFTSQAPASKLIARINDGEVLSAPVKTAPTGVITLAQVADGLRPRGVPTALAEALGRAPYLPKVVLGVSLLAAAGMAVAGGVAGIAAGLAVAAAGTFAYQRLNAWTMQMRAVMALRDEGRTAAMVDSLPNSADFRITAPDSGFTPRVGGNRDSVEATRFKTALRDSYTLTDAAARVGLQPDAPPLPLTNLARSTIAALDPRTTFIHQLGGALALPEGVQNLIGGGLNEVMHYPGFDRPMYKALCDISAELFLPNIHLIEENSITLLEANQEFIESYMVGLNHEFARELLWREYPTDQMGSYFQQFWEVRGYLDARSGDPEALRERLRDIPPIHRWPRASSLGSHDNRQGSGEPRAEVVLVVRGELLKKYPTAVIYAQQAEWSRIDAQQAERSRNRNGTIDRTKPRKPVTLTPAEEENPPRAKLKTPLYEAKVEPDIYFFGFDLTVEEARGGTGAHGSDKAGWFIMIKERPGEPRFGLDVGGPSSKWNVWNDLAWGDVTADPFLSIGGPPQLTEPTGADQDKHAQWLEDKRVTWSAGSSAADLAYILFQPPLRVAIHAAEMLGGTHPGGVSGTHPGGVSGTHPGGDDVA